MNIRQIYSKPNNNKIIIYYLLMYILLQFKYRYFQIHFKILLHLVFVNFVQHAKRKVLWNERDDRTESAKEEPEYRCFSSKEKKFIRDIPKSESEKDSVSLVMPSSVHEQYHHYLYTGDEVIQRKNGCTSGMRNGITWNSVKRSYTPMKFLIHITRNEVHNIKVCI